MTNTAEVQMKPVSELIASMKTAAERGVIDDERIEN